MKHVLLIVLQLASYGADSYYTNENIHRYHFVEHNVLARPFTHDTVTLSLTSAAGVGAILYGEHWLRKHRHERFAEALELGTIAGHTWGAAYSATHLNEVRQSH